MNVIEFHRIIQPLIHVHGEQDKEKVGTYYQYLGAISQDQLTSAVDKLIKSKSRFPTISDFMEVISENSVPTETEVWDDLNKSFIDGQYRLKFDLSEIIKSDMPGLGNYPEEECRKQVHFSYQFHSQQMKKAIRNGEKYLPEIVKQSRRISTGGESIEKAISKLEGR